MNDKNIKVPDRSPVLRGLACINEKTSIDWYAFAEHKEERVAVVSLKSLKTFFNDQRSGTWENLTTSDVKRFFGRAAGSAKDDRLCEVKTRFRGKHFANMMRQTPFKSARNNIDQNKDWFFIATATSWEAILNDFGRS